jgi:hypothetical protein
LCRIASAHEEIERRQPARVNCKGRGVTRNEGDVVITQQLLMNNIEIYYLRFYLVDSSNGVQLQ